MIQTHRTIDLVLNVTQTGTLVVNKLALVILLTDTILNINFLLSWFIGMDDIVPWMRDAWHVVPVPC